MLRKIQIKSKQKLLEMGYENNIDKDDFLNLLAGEIVTLDLDQTIAVEDGTIFISKEYPQYAIYDYLIKRVIEPSTRGVEEQYEYSIAEIGKSIGMSSQRVSKVIKTSISKLSSIIDTLSASTREELKVA